MSSVEVIVGVIGKPHGVRGEVSVEPHTDEPERRFAVGTVLRPEQHRKGMPQTYTVESARWHADRLLVVFDEVPDRTSAEAVRGVVLVVDVPTDETPDDPEEFYDRQLIGLRVIAADGHAAGTITAIQHPPVHDLLVVDTEYGERLIPFTKQLVPSIDLVTGTCQLADVGGLVDDNGEEAR